MGEELAGWHDLYVTVGAAAATLAGLLFVGLSLHIRIVVAYPDVRSLARVTLTSFFSVLLVAVGVLQPASDAAQVGLWLIGVGIVSLALLVRPLWEGVTGRGKALGVRTLAARFGLSVLCVVGLIASGGLIAVGRASDGLDLLLPMVVLLLVVAVRNTWDLLVTVAARVPDNHS